MWFLSVEVSLPGLRRVAGCCYRRVYSLVQGSGQGLECGFVAALADGVPLMPPEVLWHQAFGFGQGLML